MFRRPVFSHGLLQGLDDPVSVRAFQRRRTYDLPREVINSHQDLNGPQAPIQDPRRVNRPHMIWIPGRNGAGFWLFLCFLRGGRGYRSVSRFRPLKDVSDCRGRDEDAQQLELVGDLNPAPTEVRFGDLSHERGDLCWCLIRGTAGWLLIFDLVQPTVECGSGNAEIPGDLSLGDLEGFHMPEDEEPLADLIS